MATTTQRPGRPDARTLLTSLALHAGEVITELGKGEALVSFLEGNGTPSMVERALICPPAARLGPVTASERKSVIGKSPIRGKYDKLVDSESAYEILQGRVQERAGVPDAPARGSGQHPPAPAPQPQSSGGGWGDVLGGVLGGGSSRGRSRRMSTGEVVVKQVARSVASQVGSQIGKALVRGLLGGLGGGRR